MQKYLLVTNNSKALERYGDHANIGVEYLEGKSYLDVLIRTRDLVYEGWHLMSHPQASNLKPNQCPYKTVLISSSSAAESFERDVELIEGSIAAIHKFTKGMKPPTWPERALQDFRTIDLSVVESAINSSLMHQMILSNI